MDFPEAMRQGCKLTKPYQDLIHPLHNSACALGAALVAVMGMSKLQELYYREEEAPIAMDLFYMYWPELARTYVYGDGIGKAMPLSTSREHSVPNVVMWMNDHGGYTREEIIEWVEREVMTGRAVAYVKEQATETAAETSTED